MKTISKMICMATHDFQWQLWPFALLLWKYWGRDIQIIYYCDKVVGELPPGVQARQVPLMKERGEGHWSFQRDFGDGFMSILRELTDPVVAVSMMDYWLVSPANLDMIDGMVRYMASHDNVVRTALGNVPGVDEWSWCVDEWEGMDVMTCNPHNNFNAGIMTNCGLFNRELTLEVYKNTSVLDSEVMGWRVMQERRDLTSVWVRDAHMYEYAHVTVSTAREVAFLRDVRMEDMRIIKALLPSHVRPQEA